jgi:hypothetical protein
MSLRTGVIVTLSLAFACASTRAARASQQQQSQQQSSNSQSQANSSQTQSNSQNPPAQQTGDSVADAARKARQDAKTQPPPKKIYGNDDLTASRAGAVSVVGNANAAQNAPAKTPPPAGEKKDETYWRKQFATLRARLDNAQKDLDVSQRELNMLMVQFYQDPNKELQQQYNRDDINKKTDHIDQVKAEIASLQQQISDLTDDLRKAGGDPGWANPPQS